MEAADRLKAMILKRALREGKSNVVSELCALGLSSSLAEKLASGRKPGGLSEDTLKKLSGFSAKKQKAS